MEDNRLKYCEKCQKNVDKYYFSKHLLTSLHKYGFIAPYKYKNKHKKIIKFEKKSVILEF